jgi:pimeloyl-ACP methyl ester carboxylesterase
MALLALSLPAAVAAGEVTIGEVLSADSVTIKYDVRGDGEPALVFVHCWSCNRGFWKNQVDEFSKDLTVVTIDLGGHGESSLGRTAWSMPAFGADVAAVVNKLDLHKVILIGHSMGGSAVIEAAGLLGDKVLGIVGVDNFQDFKMKYPPDQVEGFITQFKADFPGVTRQWVAGMFPATADTLVKKEVIETMASAHAEVGISAIRELLLFHDMVTAVGKVKAPIRGINSEMAPVNVAGNKEVAADYDMVVMTGVGHFPHLEKPQEFNEKLRAIISEMAPKK